MLKMIELKCPACGADLSMEEGREQLFCQYCGAKVIVHNENEYIYRHIDEAGIKQAETDRMVQLKQMEMAEKLQEAERRKLALKIKISLALAIIGILMIVIGYMAGENTGNPDSGFYMLSLVGMFPLMGVAYIWLFSGDSEKENILDGKVKVPSSVEDCEHKNYEVIEASFRSAGFVNVKCVPLNDLTFGLIKKPGMVESIIINGEEITSGGARFLPDASVVISYHSFTKK